MKFIYSMLFVLLFSSFLVSAPEVDEGYLGVSNGGGTDQDDEDYMDYLVNNGKTVIYGSTYEQSTGDRVSGVNVTVTCIHEGEVFVADSVSSEYGKYYVVFDRWNGETCFQGDAVNIYAQKGDLYGIHEGYIDGYFKYKKDLKAWIDVPLVPEFGTVVGFLTIISAVGIFFVVRRD